MAMNAGFSCPILAKNKRGLFFAGVILFVLATIITAFITLNQLHHQVETRIATTTQNLSRSVVQTLDGMIDTVDVALLAAAREIQHQIAID